MSFETFEGERPKESGYGTPVIRVTPNGKTIVLNSAALRLFGDATHVLLQFDRSGRRIGLLPASSSDEHAYKLTRSPSTGQISGGAFVVEYDIPRHQRFRLDERDGDVLIAAIPPAADAAWQERKRDAGGRQISYV